jgi:hypothetical protein
MGYRKRAGRVTAIGDSEHSKFGRYRTFGVCEIEVSATPGSKVYVDVGPRLSYMVAGAIGGTVGGIAGAAAVPEVFSSAGTAIATGAAGLSAGSTAGAAAASTVEAKGKRCRGPYKLDVIAEEDALILLSGLTWSRD